MTLKEIYQSFHEKHLPMSNIDQLEQQQLWELCPQRLKELFSYVYGSMHGTDNKNKVLFQNLLNEIYDSSQIVHRRKLKRERRKNRIDN